MLSRPDTVHENVEAVEPQGGLVNFFPDIRSYGPTLEEQRQNHQFSSDVDFDPVGPILCAPESTGESNRTRCDIAKGTAERVLNRMDSEHEQKVDEHPETVKSVSLLEVAQGKVQTKPKTRCTALGGTATILVRSK
ncbi:hypothetical protein B0H10DRAFT_1941920 [Mycena sp. CBHHK59/15]|nr:hypothetical protein B0H10DRAFT_1941920 [Mycena sp. CBHHK59/15]